MSFWVRHDMSILEFDLLMTTLYTYIYVYMYEIRVFCEMEKTNGYLDRWNIYLSILRYIH